VAFADCSIRLLVVALTVNSAYSYIVAHCVAVWSIEDRIVQRNAATREYEKLLKLLPPF